MGSRSIFHTGIAIIIALCPLSAQSLLELNKGDHVAIVGSGLADRQQHHGWFEALIHQAYPDANLVIRNLGFATDEINITPRSQGTPPTEWFLSMKKGISPSSNGSTAIYNAGTDFGADVILAYWGFNESFKGPDGIDSFKKSLSEYLSKLTTTKYNGSTPPKVVLFSPIAHEDLQSSDFSDGAENNRNLELYTQAMAEVAKEKGVFFVNLYQPSQEIYQKTEANLTINGIHLTEEGDRLLAPIQFRAVFGKEPASVSDPAVEKIREAILEKNTQWHHRYRTVDQYNIFGERSLIDYAGVNNNVILNQELAQRDVKTANRDLAVWAAANGKTLVVKDDNLPPVQPTPTNRPEEVPYLDPTEAIKHLKLPENCKVELVASEKEFPQFVNPVQMNFDTKGRLWVAVWPNYPGNTPTTDVFDKLLVIDLDPKTGKAVKMTTFADGLNCPTGFQFYKDGVLLMQSPDLLYLRDTDGDGVADTRERVLHGLDAADSHHETNSICLEPGGAVYLSDGIFHRSSVETFNGPIRNQDGAIYRYEPNTGKFMRHAPYGFANPHGRVFDYWGNDLITDATGNDNYFGPAMSGHLDSGSHPTMKTFWNRPSRPTPGTAILSSRHFPDDWQGLFLNTNVISIQGIFRAKITEQGSGIQAETLEHLVTTDIAKNPNFRPSGITVAPDGSLYFMDWSQMIIGHLQHHLRDPNRDHQHGRLYRITYEGRPLLTPKKIDGQSILHLLDLLKEPENDVRMRAKIELGKHHPKKVTDAVVEWMRKLDSKDPGYEHQLLEALWVHQWHNVVHEKLLERVLSSPEPRARAQGVRVLGYWRDRVPDALAKVKKAADDEAPRVRLEAVRVASYFRETAAADAALTILKHPTDYYLDYCFTQTMRQLQPWWQNAIAEGKEIATDNPAGGKYLLDSVPSGELDKLPKSVATLTAIVTRPDVSTEKREHALSELAAIRKATSAATLISLISGTPEHAQAERHVLCQLLLHQPPAELKSIRSELGSVFSREGGSETGRSAAAALILADGSLDGAWKQAQTSPGALSDFLATLALIPDATLRSSAHARVTGLLSALPPVIQSELEKSLGVNGRYVRISLPRVGTLSLAEVEVMSGGKNIARGGKARQSSISNAGDAERAIDGNKDGRYFAGSVTHTAEQENNPWWEVDLGASAPIDTISIWNRTEQQLGERLDGYELTILDDQRRELFRKSGNAAPAQNADLAVTRDAKGELRRAVISALPKLGNGSSVFATLANLTAKGDQLPAAVLALGEIPEAQWGKEKAAPAVEGIVNWARSIPAEQRTSEQYLAVMKVADQLVSLLPNEQAAAAKQTLSGFGVKMITIKTVREQLRYDTTRFEVEAGKPFEIIFENPDAMPHNIVFVLPGTMQDIALAVQAESPEKLDSKGRSYVPENDPRVIDASRMLEAGQSETLKLTAPEDEGTYEFVCTFPGHWSVMKGEMIVTRNPRSSKK